MAGKEQDKRIFVGGLSRDITERQLEDAFRRFGKIIDSQVRISCYSTVILEIISRIPKNNYLRGYLFNLYLPGKYIEIEYSGLVIIIFS